MYKIIYADPPWQFKNKKTGGSYMISGSKDHYNVMSVEDICQLKINEMTTENAVLFMWWVASQPVEALKVVEAWGFKLKTMTGFNWVKKTTTDKNFFGMGFYTRQGSECCLIATKGKMKPLRHNIRAVVEAKNVKHSKKPDIFADLIVELYGNIPRIELFARDQKEGWDVFGDECDKICIQ